jgi:hypothetical protein
MGVKPVLHCILMAAVEGGEARETRGNGRQARLDVMQGRR